jgi:DNA repair exonuclease SbcCD ATPase subunit
MTLKELRQSLERKTGQRDQIRKTVSEIEEKTSFLKKEISYSEKAQIIIQKVAKETQEELEFHISDIVSMALSTVFDKPYKFRVEFVIKRNKTECDLLFENDRGEKIDPMTASGGGVVDVATLALRLALWTLQVPRSRNVIILDEPLKFLSKNLLPRAGELLQELSSKLNLQFIIVTHLSELTDCADKVFTVTQRKGVSKIING